MDTADIAAAVGLAAALYEGVAIWTDKIPTITDMVTRAPRIARALLIVGGLVWSAMHFQVF